MTDTTEEIKQLVREQIMARSSAERFVMGAEMFDSALAVVKASLPANLSSSEYNGNSSNVFTDWSCPPGWRSQA